MLKLDNLPLESVVHLYNSLPRFPAIRKRAIVAIYKKMNTFDETEVTDHLTDRSEETFFLKNLLTLNELNKSPLDLPDSFSQFLSFAVDQMSHHLLAQQLIRMNDQQLPYMKSVEREYNLSRFKERFLAPHDEPNFYIINFLDEKIHAEKGGIIDLLTEFTERLKAFLFPILSQLKQDDVFYLSSDHGFVERTGYRYKDAGRYVHGGEGVWERVVAVAKFRKL